MAHALDLLAGVLIALAPFNLGLGVILVLLSFVAADDAEGDALPINPECMEETHVG